KGVVDGDAGIQIRVVGQVGTGSRSGGLNAALVGRLRFEGTDAAAAQAPTVFLRGVGIARRVRRQRCAADAQHVGRHGPVFRVEAGSVPGGSDEGDPLVTGWRWEEVVKVIFVWRVAEAKAHGNDGNARLAGGHFDGRADVVDAEESAGLHEQDVGTRRHRM